MAQRLNGDQGRERIDTIQRYDADLEARARAAGFRGSPTWHRVGGAEYLLRSYDDGSGRPRQKNEGRRDERTDALKVEYKRERDEAQARAVAGLVEQHILHLPYEADEFRMLPRAVFDAAAPLFAARPEEADPFA